MNYSEVLSKAWQTIWKHKVLWIFGILSGCSNSGGGFGNSNITSRQDTSEQIQHYFENISQETLILIIVAAVVIILALIVIGIFLGTIGKIGLVRGALQADQDMGTRLKFGELFKGSLPYFWRVFLLNLFVGVIVFLALAILLAVGISATVLTLGMALICILPLSCLLIPVVIAVSLVVEQSILAIVIDNLGVLEGLQRGWEVIKGNLGPIALMWVILSLGVRGIGGLILGLPMLVVLSPLIAAAISGTEQAFRTGLLISAICFVAYLPFLIILSGVLNSYVQSGWTLTFLRLTKPPVSEPELLPEPAG